MIFLSSSLLFGQDENRRNLFMQFEARFPVRGYPFDFSLDSDIFTHPGVYPRRLPENEQYEFIYSQGIKPFTFLCDLERFRGFESHIQFPKRNNIYLLVICLDIPPICGSASYLLTYSDCTFNLLDYLMIDASGQIIDENQQRKIIFVESVLTEDYIKVSRRERLLPFNRLEDRLEYHTIYYELVYEINQEGQFVLLKEEKWEGVEYVFFPMPSR